jgi:hypothetical protein
VSLSPVFRTGRKNILVRLYTTDNRMAYTTHGLHL